MTHPKVSVVTITYNQEKYIEQAITSVWQQQTSFPIQYVVADDCSTDGAKSILQRLEKAGGERFQLRLRESNVGVMRNLRDAYNSVSGEYIALLEGDDYWTDPLKLQRQVELMDARPECSLSFHPVAYVDDSGKPLGQQHPPVVKPEWNLEDILYNNPIQTCSVLIRRSMLPQVPDFILRLKLADWPLCILAAHRGTVLCIDQVMADYRVHSQGVWTGAATPRKQAAVARMYLELAMANPELKGIASQALERHVELIAASAQPPGPRWSLRHSRPWRMMARMLRPGS